MLLEPFGAVVRDAVPAPFAADVDERAARRSLRAQIAGLERELSVCVQRGFPFGAVDGSGPATVAGSAGPRVLGTAGLECLRDDLAERLRRARHELDRREEGFAWQRRRLDDMLARPREHKWARVARRDVGEPGCGVWQVRPRLGLIGMLAGWWHVTVSSGCPLATAATIPAWADAAASAAARTWRRRSSPSRRRSAVRRR